MQDGKVVAEIVEDLYINSESKNLSFEYDLPKQVDKSKEYSIVYKAAIFDRILVLDTIDVK